MQRSISIVEYEVSQAQFFLENIAKCGLDFFAVQCFTDAFASTCRSITFSMQVVMNEVDGFAEWYADRTELLKKDPLSQFFNAYRNASIHIGDTVVHGGSFTSIKGSPKTQYFFLPIQTILNLPNENVFSVCTIHFTNLLRLVYEAFTMSRYRLDDRWYYTEGNFRRMGKSLEDAVEEHGFPREWLSRTSQLAEVEKWRALRRSQTVGCQLNDAFRSYLDKIISGPDD